VRRSAATVAVLLGVLALAGAAAAAPLPLVTPPEAKVQAFGVYGAQRAAVVAVNAPASFTAPVAVTPGMRLMSAVAVPDRVWKESAVERAAALRFRIVLEHDGTSTPLYERTIDIAKQASDRRWYDFGRDLSAFAGKQGTLRFEVAPVEPSGTPTLALFAVPEVLQCASAGPSLLLVTVDALRADHLSGHGYARATTPRLDAFAAGATRFTAAFAAAPKTLPSIPQTLTGRYFPEPGDAAALATLLGPERYDVSRAIVNNPFVSRWLDGQTPGFQTRIAGDELDARAITSEALRFLTAAGRCRTALYLHYLDTHTPYRAPPRFARMFVDASAQTTIGLTFDDVTGAWQQRYGEADRRRIVDLYDGAIAFTDRQLGRLFRGLARRGRMANTLVVVTADHGEEFWDHGQFFHGQSLYDELLHVPLIVRSPQGGHGRTVGDVVSTVDVLPTILESAGFPPATADGVSLLPQAAGSAGTDAASRIVFATVSHAERRSPPRHAARAHDAKVIRNVDDGSIVAYDLAADPKEQNPLTELSARARELYAVLDAVRLRIASRGWQARIRSTAAQPVEYVLTLAGEPAVPLVDIDRLTLEPSDAILLGPRSTTVTVRGRLEPGDEDQVRLDVHAASGTLNVTTRLDGTPAPAGTLRTGPDAAATQAIDLADAALVGEPPPSDALPVTVTVWRAPAMHPTGETPLDDETRERLRELGYVE
jgi:arylsulfatase